MANTEMTTTQAIEDMNALRHMLGFGSRTAGAGWRNYYNAAADDPVMRRLLAGGLVVRGRVLPDWAGDSVYFHATEAGCKLAGLNASQTAKALGRDQGAVLSRH